MTDISIPFPVSRDNPSGEFEYDGVTFDIEVITAKRVGVAVAGHPDRQMSCALTWAAIRAGAQALLELKREAK